MEIVTLRGLDGLEAVRDPVVIFDVFRASNTIIALLAAGADGVALIADLDEAYALKAAHPDWILAGERGGAPQPGFDGDNSPARAPDLRPAGRRAILTTSAGTQAVARLANAAAVFYGSFANAAALTHHLRALDPPRLALLPMGYRAVAPALEDDLAAMYLEQGLLGAPPDFAPLQERLLNSEAAGRLRGLGNEADLAFCTTLDHQPVVPRVGFGAYPLALAAPDPAAQTLPSRGPRCRNPAGPP
ncbi:MAG: 2-phosphosulfolactate phosphatase [Pseudomonadota bacterium]